MVARLIVPNSAKALRKLGDKTILKWKGKVEGGAVATTLPRVQMRKWRRSWGVRPGGVEDAPVVWTCNRGVTGLKNE